MSKAEQYAPKPEVIEATVASSTQESSTIKLHGCTPVAFETHDAITGTNYTFLGRIGGGGFKELRNNIGNPITYSSVAADGIYYLDPVQFVGLDELKIKTGSLEAADRTIKVKVHPV